MISNHALGRSERVGAKIDGGEEKARRRGGGSGGGAGFLGEDFGEAVGGDRKIADEFEGADHVADLVVEEAAGGDGGDDVIAVAGDGEAIEGAERGIGLAGGGAEAGEIMFAEERLGGLVHQGGIERGFDVPDAGGFEGGAGGAVEDDVAVVAGDGGEAGVPIGVGDCGSLEHGDGVGVQMIVEGVADRAGGKTVGRGVGQGEQGDLAGGVDAGIGAAGGGDGGFDVVV